MPLSILKTIYESLVVPYFTYCIEIYFGTPQYQKQRLEILQRKAVRAISSLAYNEHTHEYFKAMNLLKLSDLHGVALLNSMHDIVHNGNLMYNSTLHHHDTRDSELITIPIFRLTTTQNSFIYQRITKWNALPRDMRQIEDRRKFSAKLKTKIKDSYYS